MCHCNLGAHLHSKSEASELSLDDVQQELEALRRAINSRSTTREAPTDEVLERLVREIIQSRRRRDKFFDGELFGEPAWDMLLELFLAELTHDQVSVSGICYASAVPHSTALRWVTRLHKRGWIERSCDQKDARRWWVGLTAGGSASMREYFRKMAVSPD